MKTPNRSTPPVRAKLYEHQIRAYLFVLALFGLGEVMDMRTEKVVMQMNISTGKGAALLMEMG